jgi:hypothetical protein
MATQRATARAVLDRCGQTYAAQAGIRLADKPSPLYRLVVLATLLSARIDADIAVAAAKELAKDGLRSPAAMANATWQRRVDALGRGHYRRYDERTASMLGAAATLIRDRWAGDLRRLRGAGLASGLRELPGIGTVGVDIFCREAQAVWPELRPYVDQRAVKGAAAVGLPTDPARLARLVPAADLARLAAGLVRISLDKKTAAELAD